MIQAASPSIDPASRGDLTGVVKMVLTKWLQGIDDMLPARVLSYDRSTNRARVQPMVYMVNTSGDQIERAQIASIPVLQLGGGGFVLSFPIKEGDLGWIKANDRDISLFMQHLNMAQPNTNRLHSFEDAMFIPDTMFKNVTIADEDQPNAVLQSLDGTVRISLFEDEIKMTAPKITLDTPLTEITGQLIAGTNTGYVQTATFNGNIITTADVLAATVSLRHHVHNGVQTGAGNTGQPVP